jgi:hypothetical protein
MEANDEALNLIGAQDQHWLVKHRSELWPEAQKGYATEGRGALLVVFGENAPRVIVVAYTTQPSWQSPELAKHLASYNPATQMVVICVGQLADAEVVPGPRIYVVQCLTPAA